MSFCMIDLGDGSKGVDKPLEQSHFVGCGVSANLLHILVCQSSVNRWQKILKIHHIFRVCMLCFMSSKRCCDQNVMNLKGLSKLSHPIRSDI